MDTNNWPFKRYDFKSNRNTLSSIKRTTIDFELAKLFPSPFGHVELSFADGRTGIVSGYSAPAPQTRRPARRRRCAPLTPPPV